MILPNVLFTSNRGFVPWVGSLWLLDISLNSLLEDLFSNISPWFSPAPLFPSLSEPNIILHSFMSVCAVVCLTAFCHLYDDVSLHTRWLLQPTHCHPKCQKLFHYLISQSLVTTLQLLQGFLQIEMHIA